MWTDHFTEHLGGKFGDEERSIKYGLADIVICRQEHHKYSSCIHYARFAGYGCMHACMSVTYRSYQGPNHQGSYPSSLALFYLLGASLLSSLSFSLASASTYLYFPYQAAAR